MPESIRSATLALFLVFPVALVAAGCGRGEEPQSSAAAQAADPVAAGDAVIDTARSAVDEHAGHVMDPVPPTGRATADAGEHAGHAAPADPAAAAMPPGARASADPHAAHGATAAPPVARSTADPHAGHAPADTPQTARPTPDPHAGHAATTQPETPAVEAAEHAGHQPAQPAPQPAAGHEHAATDTAGHVTQHPGEHVPGDTVRHDPTHDMGHEMPGDMSGALGIPMQREASGTGWLPDASPMYALHSMRGRWMYMLHGVVYVNYINEGSTRGDTQFGSTNWFMGMARTEALGGHASLRAMLSAEPVTVGRCGYPNLLATGETCRGRPLHDRQHPHDLFMELAGMYERELSPRLGLQLYGGLAGEPALGPVAYPHRISAISNPMAPIGHHWHDATHISFGLVTAGLFGRTWKLEASAFNGREPDEERYNIDLDRLDSFAGRVWWLPNTRWAMQVSTGHLKEAEPAIDDHGREDVTRTTASATYHLPFAQSSLVATTLLWGRNSEHGETTDAWLLESNLDLGGRHIFFARAEQADKPGKDLQVFVPQTPCIGICALSATAPLTPPEGIRANGLVPVLSSETFRVRQLTGGYLYQFRPIGDMILSGGTRLSLSLLPKGLEQTYGNRSPAGVTLFVSLRPRAHRLDTHAEMGH